MYKDLRGLQKSSEVLYDLWLRSQVFSCYDKLHGNKFHHEQLVAGRGTRVLVLMWNMTGHGSKSEGGMCVRRPPVSVDKMLQCNTLIIQ